MKSVGIPILRPYLVGLSNIKILLTRNLLPSAGLFLALGALNVRAANTLHTYAAGSSGNFSAATWTGGVPGSSPGDMCNDSTASSPAASTLTLDVNVTIGSIKVNSSGGHSTTFNADATPHVLTIDGTGITAGNQPFGNAGFGCIMQNANAGTLTVNAPISLATVSDIGQNQAGVITIGGNITAVNAVGLNLRRNGGGALNLNGTIGSSGSMISITNIGASGNALTLSAVIGPNASITQNSATSPLTISGAANTYTGNTVLLAGIINIGSSSTLGSGAGSLTLSGGTLNTTASRTPSSAPIVNPLSLTADSIVQTTSTAATVDLNFTNSSISGSGGTLIFSNAAASGTGVFQPRFSGGSFTFSRPIILANSANGTSTTRLDSYNTNGTTQTFGGVISGTGSYSRTASTGTGGLTIFTGNNTYSGGTTINNGTLEIDNTAGSGTGSGNVAVNSGGTLAGSGTISGNVTVASGGHTRPGTSGVTNTIGGNLLYAAGAKADFDLTSSATGNGNSQIILSGTSSVLSGSNATVSINCGATLDQANDYVLYQLTGGSATIVSNFNATPVWLGTVPANSGSFTVVTDITNKKVLLHYISATAPTATGSASPPTLARNQSTLISVTVTPGSGTISSVIVNLSAIGGAASVPLTLSGVANVYTNTITVPAAANVGSTNLVATVTDSTPLAGTANIAVTIVSGNEIWNGAGSSDNWSTNANWISGLAPGLVGDAVTFAGSTRLTPVMENSYTLPSLTFDSTAGSFNITNASASALTLSGGITNNSANAQIINLPIILSVGQTFNTASGDVAVNGIISGSGAGVLKAGGSTLTLIGANTYDGPTTIANGTVQLANALALQNSPLSYSAGNLTFSNITAATLGGLSGSQNLSLINATSAPVALTIGGNGASTTYSGQLSGAGASLSKSGTNTLTLTANNSYTGATTVNAGILQLNTGSVINGAAASVAGVAGAQLVINGGSLTASASANLAAPSAGLLLSSGSATLTGGLTVNAGNSSQSSLDAPLIATGGTLTAASLAMGRTGSSVTTQPTAASTTTGLYVNGATVSITGNVALGNTSGANSTTSARMDSGSLTVGGSFIFGLNNGGRWSVVDVNGGTFAVIDTSTGLSVGSSQTGNAVFLMRAGTATLGKVSFGQGATVETAVLNQTGGSLYIGSGGIAQVSTGVGFVSTVTLNGGTLGAAADWSSTLAMTLGGTTIQAADAASAAQNITLGGVLSGTSLTKTGNGILTLNGVNTYTGSTSVSNGTLAVNGSIGSGAVTVTNATLSGAGTIGGVTTLQPSAILDAGTNHVGTLNFSGALTLNALATNNFVVTTAGGASNKVAVVGALTPNSSVIRITSGTALHPGTNTLFTYGTISGSFNPVLVFDVAPAHAATLVDDAAGHINLVVPNHAPLAGNTNYSRNAGIASLKINISDLVTANTSDADGDGITLSSLGVSTNGVTLTTSGGTIFYTNPNSVNDQFSYSVSDGLGGIATGLVTISVSTNPVSGQMSGNVTVTGSTVSLSFQAIPGYTYEVQRTTSLVPEAWVDISTNMAAANGSINLTDNFSDLAGPPASAYYRLKWQP